MIDSKTIYAVVSNENLCQCLHAYKKWSYKAFKCQMQRNIKGMEECDKRADKEMQDIQKDFDKETIDNGFRVLKSKYNRTRNLTSRIDKILSREQERAFFLTLTFSDKVLSDTSIETRRKYVSRFLKAYSSNYVANIDYGKENEREHYHAVAILTCDTIRQAINKKNGHKIPNTYELPKWTFGLSQGKEIKIENEKALAKYVLKFKNHALKQSDKRQFLIYSRNIKVV